MAERAPSPPSQESIDAGLLRRLLRPIQAPGVISLAPARRIFAMVNHFTGRVSLLTDLSKRRGRGQAKGGELPLVYARWVRVEGPVQGASLSNAAAPARAAGSLGESVAVPQAGAGTPPRSGVLATGAVRAPVAALRPARSDEALARSDEALARTFEATARSNEAPARSNEPTARTLGTTPHSSGPTARSNEPTARTLGTTPHSNGPTARTLGTTPHSNEPTARTNEATARTFEATARTFEATARTNEAPARTFEALAQKREALGGRHEALARPLEPPSSSREALLAALGHGRSVLETWPPISAFRARAAQPASGPDAEKESAPGRLLVKPTPTSAPRLPLVRLTAAPRQLEAASELPRVASRPPQPHPPPADLPHVRAAAPPYPTSLGGEPSAASRMLRMVPAGIAPQPSIAVKPRTPPTPPPAAPPPDVDLDSLADRVEKKLLKRITAERDRRGGSG